MLQGFAFAFLNHVLSGEAWARSRLKPFAGGHARFSFGLLTVTLTVCRDGSLAEAPGDIAPEVSIRFPDDALFRLLADRDSLFGAATVSGAADFAEALGFVARNIRWDVESDLARFVGDIAARRALLATRRMYENRQESSQRFLDNLAEYVVDEEELVMRPSPLRQFSAEVGQLEADLMRLTERIARLD